MRLIKPTECHIRELPVLSLYASMPVQRRQPTVGAALGERIVARVESRLRVLAVLDIFPSKPLQVSRFLERSHPRLLL